MGCCHDSSILRPLLSQNNGSINNSSNNLDNNRSGTTNRRRWFSFWRNRRRGYNDVEEEGYDIDELKLKYRKRPVSHSSSTPVIHDMARALRIIGLLLWKNLLIRRRHWIITILELLFPIVGVLSIIFIRSTVQGKGGGSGTFQAGGGGGGANEIVYPPLPEALFPMDCGIAIPCIVAFAPNTTENTDIISRLQTTNPSSTMEFRGYESESDIEKFVASVTLNMGSNETVRAAIVFLNEFGQGDTFGYKIRLLEDEFKDQRFYREIMKSTFPSFESPGPDPENLARYASSGFTGFQLNLDKVLIEKYTKAPVNRKIYIQPFPYPPYKETKDFKDVFLNSLPMMIAFGFMFISPSIIRGVVNEKDSGIKELMKLFGIPNWMHWMAWAMTSMLLLSISITIITIFVCGDFIKRGAGAMFLYANPVLVFTTLWLYVLASVMFCFFISSFFQRAFTAIPCGLLLWLLTYAIPQNRVASGAAYTELSLTDKLALALFPNMAMVWSIRVSAALEGKGIGAQFHNLFEPLSATDSLNLGQMYIMFIVDAILYYLLTLYVEAVLPSQYGITLPWYFIFKPSFWRGQSNKNIPTDDDCGEVENPAFEPGPTGLRAGVVLNKLHKSFGRKTAVDRLSLKMYDGEIFALLGHNGAGKTTAISMCTGMISPTSGTAMINGYSIRTEMNRVREQIGICPQHNLLFDDLTVDEHLNFFGNLKGITTDEARNERQELLRNLQLTEKAGTFSKKLSGGQKRKLSLAIALIGKAKVVFLDEPTSGMDVEARRAVWDLLLGERGGRTIILTTHFMEEADILGDRIGIMASGKLQCVGSSLFLKKYYGAGYTLSLTMKDVVTSSIENRMLSLVQKYVTGASVSDDPHHTNLNELSITLPTDDAPTSIFPSLFKEIENHKQAFGVDGIGLSFTTLDEVFIKVDEQALPEKGLTATQGQSGSTMMTADPDSTTLAYFLTPETSAATSAGATTTMLSPNSTGWTLADEHKQAPPMQKEKRVYGAELCRAQFLGLIQKRMMYTWRKRLLILAQLCIPVALLIGAIYLGNMLVTPPGSTPSLKIGLKKYRRIETLYTSSDPDLGKTYASVVGSSAVNITGKDMINELLRRGKTEIGLYRGQYIVAADLSSENVTSLYSTIPYHAAPLSLNIITNTLLKTSLPTSPRIEVSNHPLTGTFSYLKYILDPTVTEGTGSAIAVVFVLFVPIGFALLAASFVVSPIEERLCNAKQLQLMTGVSPVLYWGVSFLWDLLLMTIVIVVMIICFEIFQFGELYTSYNGAGVFFLIAITYGFAVIPMSYIISLFPASVGGGFSLIALLQFLAGTILPLVVNIMEGFAQQFQNIKTAVSVVHLLSRFVPTFGASMSIFRFVEIAFRNSKCSLLPSNAESVLCDPAVTLHSVFRYCCQSCESMNGSCFKPEPYILWKGKDVQPGIGKELFFMFLVGMFYIVLLLLIETGAFQRLKSRLLRVKVEDFKKSPDDEDVEREDQRIHQLVQQGKVHEDAMVVEDLCKNYGSFPAVANLNFGVHHGECFGLLGVNGAGKTTTFRMITADEIRSSGNVFAGGHNLEKSAKKFLNKLGYCPQFDGIIGCLTGREMVALFGSLRGVKHLSRSCDIWLERVGLVDSRDVQCGKYSGGMKRRLSAAMAMIGEPDVVLLDEPTSGVDPVSRREFWKVILATKASGRAVVLTSHSMDEITTCCGRLGIMVNGQLQCIGTVQHLKQKFAQGYTLSVRIKPDTLPEAPDFVKLERDISKTFRPCSLKDKHQTALSFRIEDISLTWDVLFQRMEDIKTRYGTVVEDYSIAETTLEEVFLSFARKQYDARHMEVSLLHKIITCQCCC